MTSHPKPKSFSTEDLLLQAQNRDRIGAWRKALDLAVAALAMNPADIEALRRAAAAATDLGDYPAARGYYDRILSILPDDAAAWCSSGHVARLAGDPVEALNRISRAASLEPTNSKYTYAQRVLSGTVVPAWHFTMLNDDARNVAYADAIARHVKPHHSVLEIGTGAGLLALLAAKAGAKHVYTCEANPAIAAKATEIVKRNGFSERITVIPKMSSDLIVGQDLPARADVLISEVFSPQLLSEEVLPTFEDAATRLLAANAIIIPARATLRGALVGGPGFSNLVRVDRVMGFDFTPFNAFTPILTSQPGRVFEQAWQSDPVDLLKFDFLSQRAFPPQAFEVGLQARQSGFCQGVLTWLQIELDDVSRYENRPGASDDIASWHWPPVFFPFETPTIMMERETVTVVASHDRNSVQVSFKRVGF